MHRHLDGSTFHRFLWWDDRCRGLRLVFWKPETACYRLGHRQIRMWILKWYDRFPLSLLARSSYNHLSGTNL